LTFTKKYAIISSVLKVHKYSFNKANTMTKELETYFNNYFELFRSEGWKQLISDLQNNGVNINSVELTKDANDLYFRKGQINILGTVLNLENQITNAHSEALTEQPSQEDFEL
jgi:hypothetical protein